MEGRFKCQPHKNIGRRNSATQRSHKNKFRNIKNILSQNTNEFCKNTTLHGLRYIVNEELYPLERTFFAISFILVLMAAGFFILSVYTKWQTTPVIFGISPEPTFITAEPFPAVTICNLNQALKSKAQDYSVWVKVAPYTGSSANISYSVEYAMLQLLCRRKVNVSVADTITDWNNLDRFITNISQPCEEMLLFCRFGDAPFNCTDFFQAAVTDEGLCCVFNMVHPKFMHTKQFALVSNLTYANEYQAVEWNPEGGYPKKLPKNFVPRRTAGTGETLGLTIILDVDADNYYCSSCSSIGFKIALHSPTETPNMQESGLLLAAGRETKVRIRAEKIESEQQLRSMNKRSRQCLFRHEKHLLYFKYYTQRNCEMECMAAMMIKYCGCISHYMPKIYGTRVYDTCSIYDVSCIDKVRRRYVTNDGCSECLPNCFDLTFNPDFFSTPLSNAGLSIDKLILKNISSDYLKKNIAIVNMYFKENAYRSNKRTEYIGFTDFLSSVGGLMGLFLGFSFISLAEFFYYAFVRPYRMVHQKKKQKTHKPSLRDRLEKRFSEHYAGRLRVELAERREIKQKQLLNCISGTINAQENSYEYKNFFSRQIIW